MGKSVRTTLLLAIVLQILPYFAQQNMSLLNHFYRDRYFLHSSSENAIGNAVFPMVESTYDISKKIADSSLQYYDATEVLFKKHLLEFKGDDYYITISPVFDFSMGKDLQDTNNRRLFQNTRGIFIEADLMKNFSFSTAIYENQARFSAYESVYYSSIGELYPNQSSGQYGTQNAVVPGSARTKPFKNDGFDYAYAQGNLVYSPHKNVQLIAGNTTHFFGNGYRSMLLSDNSVGAPFFRVDWSITPKLKFVYLRQRLLNLMRKPVSSTVESYYEAKGLSVNYLSYQPLKNLSISLFESAVWSRGDSLTSHFSSPLLFNPIPFVAPLAMSKQKLLSVLGINFGYTFAEKHVVYGQFAVTNLNFKRYAHQLGYRVHNLFNLKDFVLQVEWNGASAGMYESPNKRLNYVHYNLPIAHPKGNNFQEILLRLNYEIKRIYIDWSVDYFALRNYHENQLLPVDRALSPYSVNLLVQQLELGYRFNKKMNFSTFVALSSRSKDQLIDRKTMLLQFGLKTAINNHNTQF
ncbi:MAG: hypothetical protein V4638_09325 [Bacteroidota bacterium]